MKEVKRLDVAKIKGALAEASVTQKAAAKHIGVCEATFISRMKRGNFKVTELAKLVELLKKPVTYFF